MSIKEKQEQIISDFELFDDWASRYEYIIDLGKSIDLIEESKKTEDYLIKGCQSQVWLDAELHEGKVHFKADSDAVITKGIAALLIKIFDDSTPEEILKADLYFIDKIGLKEHLSPTRSNGLVSMLKQMKIYALAYNESVKN